MQILSRNALEFWVDARHMMNDMSERQGAAIVIAAPEGVGFVAEEHLEECERVIAAAKILHSQICT